MITVTLVRPARLQLEGQLWERGVPVPATAAYAQKFVGNPRFRVEGLGDDTSRLEPGKRPASAIRRLQVLKVALSDLDPDDADAWCPDGKPNRYALSAHVGWPVSEEDRDSLILGGTERDAPVDPDPEDPADASEDDPRQEDLLPPPVDPAARKVVVRRAGAKAEPPKADDEPTVPVVNEPSVKV